MRNIFGVLYRELSLFPLVVLSQTNKHVVEQCFCNIQLYTLELDPGLCKLFQHFPVDYFLQQIYNFSYWDDRASYLGYEVGGGGYKDLKPILSFEQTALYFSLFDKAALMFCVKEKNSVTA